MVCGNALNVGAALSSWSWPRRMPVQAGLERAGETAQAGIARHDFDQRRGLLELAGQLRDFLGRQEQQTVLLEELAAIEPANRIEILLVG